MEEHKRYVALDQSLSNTGIAILIDDTVHHTCLKTKDKFTTEVRLEMIEQALHNICEVVKPTEVFFEDMYIMASRLNVIVQLVKVETVINQYLLRNKIAHSQLPADCRKLNSWRRYLGLPNGKEFTKERFSSMMSESTTEHEFDAVGILFGSFEAHKIPYNIGKLTFKRYKNERELFQD